MSDRNPYLDLLQPTQPEIIEPKGRMRARGELTPGARISEWTLIRHIAGMLHGPNGKRLHAKWECKCSCGQIREVVTGNLHSGVSKSCGHDRIKRK